MQPTEPPDEPPSRQEAAIWADKLLRFADELDGAPPELGFGRVAYLQELLHGMAAKMGRIAYPMDEIERSET